MDIIEQSIGTGNPSGQETPNNSLRGLLDLLSATKLEWATLPSPLPLFLHESEQGLADTLGVAGDGI